jgi:ubiquinone/menaquinone biosynthesis C-methylase UbiE
MDATRIDRENNSVDVVTALEVLEHITESHKAASEAVRVARRFVVATVPSKDDDNPEHIHLFDKRSLEDLFLSARASSVKIDFVLNHMIAVARV